MASVYEAFIESKVHGIKGMCQLTLTKEQKVVLGTEFVSVLMKNLGEQTGVQ